jgi:hypothetical protein
VHILSYLALGRGSKVWMRLGTAIRMCLGLEMHRERPITTTVTFRRDVAYQCVHTLYLMDRFSVCGSNRPMIVDDGSLTQFRLPGVEDRVSDSDPNSYTFLKFDELQNYSSSRNQGETILVMITTVSVLLGKCNNYLQRGGVQGDSHFPWHPMSNLSGLVSELKNWKDRIASTISFENLDCSLDTNICRFYLSWLIYHTIFVRIYRQFLPLIISGDGSGRSSNPWQQETSKKCVDNAVAIAELCEGAERHGFSWPPFSS